MKEHDTHIEYINENGGSLHSYINGSNRSFFEFSLKGTQEWEFFGSDFEICAFS
jgi:hypothetical protein